MYSDHQALKFLNSQRHLNPKHAKWVEFLQKFTFVVKHRAGIENKVADALSRRILHTMQVQVVGFERLIDKYPTCPDFSLIYQEVSNGSRQDYPDFLVKDDYLFRGSKLCVPRTSL